jgi:hypothetical protein
MTLQHSADAFTDVFVLVRTPTADWRIASKAYGSAVEPRRGGRRPGRHKVTRCMVSSAEQRFLMRSLPTWRLTGSGRSTSAG